MPETVTPAGLIPIARVDRVRGIIGEVVVTVFADDPARMARLASVFLRSGGPDLREMAIEGVKRLGDRVVLKLSGYSTPEQARELIGQELYIPKEASTPAPKGRYYAWQLEGLEVRLKGGRTVGRIREILNQGAQSLMVIDAPEGEVLVPMVRAICVEIDPEGGVVTLDPPEGLIDLNIRSAAPPREARGR